MSGGRDLVTVCRAIVLTGAEVKAPSGVLAARVRESASLGFPPPVGHAAAANT